MPTPTAHAPPPHHPPTSLLAAFFAQEPHTSQRRVPGQGLVEYALVLVLIAIVSIGALTLVGNQTNDVFEEINCRLSGGQMHTDSGQGNSNRCVGQRGNGR